MGSVLQGRLIDRVGATRPLLVAAAVFAGAVTGLIAAVQTGRPLPLMVLLAVTTGLTQPAIEGAARALWGRLIPPGPSATPPTPTRRSASRSSSSSARHWPRCCPRPPPGPVPGSPWRPWR
jgi:MFS family permease